MQKQHLDIFEAVRRVSLATVSSLAMVISGAAWGQDAEEAEGDEEAEREEIIVTGTRLNLEAGQLSKQVISITAEDLKKMGEPTLGRAIARIPQNYGGLNDSNAYYSGRNGIGVANGAANVAGAVTASLRGFGSSGTLVLVDGNRIGKSGIQGGVQDLSVIPMSMVERIDIVMDGASSIYGSDAVGGVINIITKKNVESLSLEMRMNAPADMDNQEFNFSLTGGKNWDNGNLIADISYDRQTSLNRDELDANLNGAAGILFSPQGFVDEIFAPMDNPVNVYLNDDDAYLSQAGGGTMPALADLQDWVQGPANLVNPIDMVPKTEELKLYVKAEQNVSDAIRLFGSVSFSDRTVNRNEGFNEINTDLETDNPFNPTIGTAQEQRLTVKGIYPALGQRSSKTTKTAIFARVGMDWQLTDDWLMTVSAGYDRSKENYAYDGYQDLYDGQDEEIFNPWGDGTGSLGDPYTWADECNVDENGDPATINGTVGEFLGRCGNSWAWGKTVETSLDAVIRGSLFEMPAGPVQVVFGGEYRKEKLTADSYSNRSSNFINAGTDQGEINASQRKLAAFGEIFVPLLAEKRMFHDLNVSASIRTEEYRNAGYTTARRSSNEANFTEFVPNTSADGKKFNATTWSAGAVWAPVERIRFKGNYSTSFMAPSIQRLFDPVRETEYSSLCGALVGFSPFIGLDANDPYPTNWLHGCPLLYKIPRAPVFDILTVPDYFQEKPYTQFTGGNPNLRPQRGKSLALTVEINPTDDLRLSLTKSRTNYKDKFTSVSRFFRGGSLVVAGVEEVFADVFEFYDDGEVKTVLSWTQNLDRQLFEALDYRLTYTPSTDFGDFTFDVNWTATLKSEEKLDLSVDRPDLAVAIDLVGLDIPKYNGKFHAGWYKDGWSVNVDTIYRHKTHDWNFFQRGETGYVYRSKWVTNMMVSYNFGERDSILKNVLLTAGFNNLFDARNKTDLYRDGEKVAETNFNAGSGRVSARDQSFFVSLRKEF